MARRDQDVRVGGGVNVIQQYLRHPLINEIHIALSPVLLGSGE
jgi:dihydrofolate reductase